MVSIEQQLALGICSFFSLYPVNSVEVYHGAMRSNCSIDFLPNAKHLSVVEKSAFTDIPSKVAWSHL